MTGPRLAADFLILFWMSVMLFALTFTAEYGWQSGFLAVSAVALIIGWIECLLWIAALWEDSKELGD